MRLRFYGNRLATDNLENRDYWMDQVLVNAMVGLSFLGNKNFLWLTLGTSFLKFCYRKLPVLISFYSIQMIRWVLLQWFIIRLPTYPSKLLMSGMLLRPSWMAQFTVTILVGNWSLLSSFVKLLANLVLPWFQFICLYFPF